MWYHQRRQQSERGKLKNVKRQARSERARQKLYAGQKQTTFEKYYEYLHMIEQERDGAGREREGEGGGATPWSRGANGVWVGALSAMRDAVRFHVVCV